MGEVQEAIASRECEEFEVRFSEDFSCRSKADRCGSKSTVGASEGSGKEGGVVFEASDIDEGGGPVYRNEESAADFNESPADNSAIFACPSEGSSGSPDATNTQM